MDDAQAGRYLVNLCDDAREGIRFLLSLREPPQNPDADLAQLAALDETVLHARLTAGGPALRSRFAVYLKECAELNTPEALARFLDSFK